jgi:hypothetical protein
MCVVTETPQDMLCQSIPSGGPDRHVGFAPVINLFQPFDQVQLIAEKITILWGGRVRQGG